MSEEEQLPDWRAQLDQMAAGLRDMAKLIGSYHRHLRAQGLSESAELALILAYQTELMRRR